ncbi:hypothetical protein CROQUDRAFT_278074 [Cronartium quercuum f. sp. fusiforme G11]|uniref:HAMP domain-containing protein n=1 Tax=Cronartium quercuum f. sp. fusiforme G11 TaxID=708437 RepID=A0A9P6NPM4_9BASI|nr:hypothetical protein CROQUDRAFT_278074 [Cronartium quercuum f. sp. fusiforme G11]
MNPTDSSSLLPKLPLAAGARTSSTASFSTIASFSTTTSAFYSDLGIERPTSGQSSNPEQADEESDSDVLPTPLTPPSVLFPPTTEPTTAQTVSPVTIAPTTKPIATISSLSYLPSVNNHKHRIPFTDFLAEQFLKIQSLSPITTRSSDLGDPSEPLAQYKQIRLELNEYILKNSSLSNPTNPNRDGRMEADVLQQNEIIILNGLLQLLDDKLLHLTPTLLQPQTDHKHQDHELINSNTISYDIGGGRDVDERNEAEEVEDDVRSKIIINDKELTAEEELKLLKAQVRDFARVCKAVARGDLSQTVTINVQGHDLTELKAVVNGMVQQLRCFAGEVTRVSIEVGTEGRLGGQAISK